MIKSYVVGFYHDDDRVVLIEKKRPKWQVGMLNGVGGHIEKGETPHEAMVREFYEEAGVHAPMWKLGIVFANTRRYGVVHFFSARGLVDSVSTKTSETVLQVKIKALPDRCIPNLRWLIPLCLDDDIRKPVLITDNS